jgi:hypothetical protein
MDVDHITEGVLNSPENKMTVGPIPYRPSANIHFSMELQVISDMLLFIPVVAGSTAECLMLQIYRHIRIEPITVAALSET